MAVSKTLEEHVDFPSLPSHSQSGPSLCGIAVIRSVLEAQFGEKASEREVIQAIGKKKGWPREEYWTRVRKGLPPKTIADYFKEEFSGVKVFCSRRGNASRLDLLFSDYFLVPIIHKLVSYPEDGDFKKEGHYLVYAGQSQSTVRIFDPSVGEGYQFLLVGDFHHQWYNKGERWYFVVVPEEIRLPQEKFKGKYL